MSKRAVLTMQLQKYAAALPMCKKAAMLCANAGDSLCYADNLSEIVGIYGMLDSFAQAYRYFNQAMPLVKKYGTVAAVAANLNSFGILYSRQNKPAEAIPYISQAVDIYHDAKMYAEEAQVLNNLAAAHCRLKQYDTATAMYKRCIAINTAHHFKENLIYNYAGLTTIYQATKNWEAATDYLGKYYELKDSIMGSQTQLQIADLGAKYQSAQKDLALQKNELALNAANQKIYNGVLILLFLGILIGFGVWRWHKQAQDVKEKLKEYQASLAYLTQILLDKNTALAALLAPTAPPDTDTNDIDINDTDTNDTAITETIAAQLDDDEALYNRRILTNTDAAAFTIYFEKAYPNYLQRLRREYATISESEERLFLLLKLNLNNKEIANILGISADSQVKRVKSDINMTN